MVTDRRTDKSSYRDAWTYLKTSSSSSSSSSSSLSLSVESLPGGCCSVVGTMLLVRTFGHWSTATAELTVRTIESMLASILSLRVPMLSIKTETLPSDCHLKRNPKHWRKKNPKKAKKRNSHLFIS